MAERLQETDLSLLKPKKKKGKTHSMSKPPLLECTDVHNVCKCNISAICYCVRLLPTEQEGRVNTNKICKASPEHNLLAEVGTEEIGKHTTDMLQLK